MVTTHRTTSDALTEALATLQSQCDGAVDRDGVGFNRFDAPFARDMLARSATAWTHKQTRAVWAMLAKYRFQLAQAGIVYADLPEPIRPDDVRLPAIEKLPRRITADNHSFVLSFDFDRAANEAVEQTFPGARYDSNIRAWRVRFTPENVRALPEFAQTHDFSVERSAELQALDTIEAAGVVKTAQQIVTDVDLSRFNGTLRPYQRESVEYALWQHRCLLGLEVGLGKTPVALATYAASGFEGPLVVVVLAVKKLDWEAEIQRFLPGTSVLVVNGTKKLASYEADAIVVNFDILHAHVAALCERYPTRFVVVDESQAIKTRNSRRTKAVQRLAEQQEWVLLLTGTPVLNRPAELAEQLRAMRRLPAFGGWFKFMTEYAGGRQGRFGWEFDRPADGALKRLHTKLKETCYVRFGKAEVMPDLPPVQRSIVPVEISNRRVYAAMEDDFIGYLMDNVDDEAAMRAARAEQLTRVTALKRCAAEGKVKAATAWIEEFLENSDQSLIVFSGVREVQKSLYEAFPGSVRIFGEDSAEQRQEAMRRFQNDDACRLIICSIKAAGTGITLTAATNCVFTDLPWTPAEVEQGEGRAYGRVNDIHGLNSYFLIGVGTVDEDIAYLLDSKQNLIDAVTTGDVNDQDVFGALLERMIEKRRRHE